MITEPVMEMVGWHHRLNAHEFEQAPGVGDGQGSLVYFSPWGRKESDMTWQLNNNDSNSKEHWSVCIFFKINFSWSIVAL